MNNTELLQMKLNTIQMYKNTLDEMIEKNSGEQKLEAIKKEIKTLTKEIRDIIDDNEDTVDTVVKNKTKNDVDSNDFFLGVVDSINSGSFDNHFIFKKRFLIRFPGEEISEWEFVGFQENFNDRKLFITLNDFVYEDENGTRTLVSILNKLKKQFYIGDIVVDYLKRTGEVLYSEVFKNCSVVNIQREGMNYEEDGFRKVHMILDYDEIETLNTNEATS